MKASCLIPLFILLTSATSINSFAQNDNELLLAAHSNADRALLTADSLLFFSTFSPDFTLIRSNGQELNRDQSWKTAKGMPEGMKLIGQIVSKNIEEPTAWITYRYSFTRDTTYSEVINYVDDLADYRWIATSIFVKNSAGWQLAHHHYSDAPED